MTKYLVNPCANIKFNGFNVSQYHVGGQGWYIGIQISAALIDVNGTDLGIPNSMQGTSPVAGPFEDMKTPQWFALNWDKLLKVLKYELIRQKVENAALTQTELEAEGFSVTEIKEVI